MESKIDTARRCYPKGTQFKGISSNKTRIITNPVINTRGTTIYIDGYVIHYRNKWAEIILPEPKIGMRVQRGPDWDFGTQGKGACGSVYVTHPNGNIGVNWDNRETSNYPWANYGVIPVTPGFDNSKPQCDKGAAKKLFTIQDLANGKCAVKNDGTLDELKAVMLEARPYKPYTMAGTSKAFILNSMMHWNSYVKGKPIQSVKDFVLSGERFELNEGSSSQPVSESIKVKEEKDVNSNSKREGRVSNIRTKSVQISRPVRQGEASRQYRGQVRASSHRFKGTSSRN